MLLHLLCSGPTLEIYYDSVNDWLYADWLGELTLPDVQQACLELAHCYQQHPHPRVLNNNMQVTDSDWEVPAWLGRHFLGHLSEVGVTHLAWVCSPTVRGRSMAQEATGWVSEPTIALFADVEDAVAWLQHTRTEPAAGTAQLLPVASPATPIGKLVHTLGKVVHGVAQPLH